MNFSERPEASVPLTQQYWPEGTRPIVSICCITYNHKNYIAEAIEGFLMQETSFPVEILIHDDASTDGTADIVRDYQSRYPKLIHATLQTENQFSKGVRPGVITRAKARGDFIACCEGDDYWIDSSKLERQVAYLRDHPQVVLSFHDVLSVDSNGSVLSQSKISAIMGAGQPARLLNYKMISCTLIPTLSIVYRNQPLIIGPRGKRVTNGDAYLYAMLARYGEMHNIGITMGAHRRHLAGVWTTMNSAARMLVWVQTLEAIAWEIDPEYSLAASRHLAECSWEGLWQAFRLHQGNSGARFSRAYFVGLICCIRAARTGWRSVPAVILTQLRIICIPPCFFVAALRRHLKKLVSRRQAASCL